MNYELYIKKMWWMKVLLALITYHLSFITSTAQVRGVETQVLITPDHKDWNYKVGEPCCFKVMVMSEQCAQEAVTIDYEAGPLGYPDRRGEGLTLNDGTWVYTDTLDRPGFLRLKVTAHVGEKTYKGLCTVGYAPERISPVETMPADFQSYWEGEVASLRKIPFDVSCSLLPDRCTDKVNVYEVGINNVGGSRIYGILCRPKAPGRYPALLNVPGAGVRPYGGDIYTASLGVITLSIGIHGIPVTMEKSVYDDLSRVISRYPTFCIDNRETYYYHRVVLGAVRSADYLASLPDFNGVMGVTGASQGGFLSLATAALNEHVSFLAVVHPACGDMAANLNGMPAGWPMPFEKTTATAEKRRTVQYHDAVNFARLVHQPLWATWGYNDETVPPSTMYAIYNSVTSEKQLQPYYATGHFWYEEQVEAWNAWVRGRLGVMSDK